jgi:hypothetical protein
LRVTGPLGEPVSSFYGLMGDGATAVIEMAAASGLELVPPEQRDPLRTTSRGTGELIRNALNAGRAVSCWAWAAAPPTTAAPACCRRWACACSTRRRRARPGRRATGADWRASTCQGSMRACKRMRVPYRLRCRQSAGRAAGRVGRLRAAERRDTGDGRAGSTQSLAHYADVIARDLGRQIAAVPGAGAGGGIARGMVVFLDGRLRPAVEIVPSGRAGRRRARRRPGDHGRGPHRRPDHGKTARRRWAWRGWRVATASRCSCRGAQHRHRRLPGATLPSEIYTLVWACALPAIVTLLANTFIGIAGHADYVLQAVDRDLNTGISMALALSNSPSLDSGDFAAFHALATKALRPEFPGFNFVLSDRDSVQLLNTVRPMVRCCPIPAARNASAKSSIPPNR